MTTDPPLTTPDCDLRDFRFMPLDVVRLSQSDMVATASSSAIVADLLLWCAAWHQVPAASLPNDDRVLSNLAGFGRVVSAWHEVKDEVLSRWTLCSDGRWYHAVVAEKAREAFRAKLAQRHRAFLAAVRKHNERNAEDKREGLSFEDWDAIGRPKEVGRVAPPAPPPEQAELPEMEPKVAERVTTPNVTRDTPPKSHATDRNKPRDKASKGEGEGEGQGEGQGQGELNHINQPTRTDPVDRSVEELGNLGRDDFLRILNRLAKVGGVALRPDRIAPFNRELEIVKGWLAAGIDVDKTIVPTIAARLAATDEDTIGSLRFYDRDVVKAHAKTLTQAADKARSKPVAPAAQLASADDADERIATVRTRLNGNLDHAPDRIALSVGDDGGDAILVVTARSPFAASKVDRAVLAQIAGDVFGSAVVTIRVQ